MPNLTTSHTSSVKASNGNEISYRLTVPSDASSSSTAPIVLLANSLIAPFGTWDHYVQYLVTRNFRVLCYNQRGHGESTVNSTTIDETDFKDLASDARELLDGLEIKQLHAWVGISMGATIGIYFSSQNPGRVKNLVICDTISHAPMHAGIDDPFEPRIQTAKDQKHLDTLIQGTLKRWFSEEWRNRNTEEVERMRTIMKGTQVDGFIACCRALQKESFDLRPLFKKLGGCVERAMVVVGELDANLPVTMKSMRDDIQEGFQQAGKQAEVDFHIIKGAGHVSVVDGFDEYKAIVTKFLES